MKHSAAQRAVVRDEAKLRRKLDVLVRKRNYAADVLNKPLLAWTYQAEIDKLVDAAIQRKGTLPHERSQ